MTSSPPDPLDVTTGPRQVHLDVTMPTRLAGVDVTLGGAPRTLPASAFACCPMVPGRWWPSNPGASSANSGGLTNGIITYQPVWTGPGSHLLGVHVSFGTAVDTGSNVWRIALYASDPTGVIPLTLVAELGSIPTTTVAPNPLAKVLVCDQAWPPNTPMWLAVLPEGGTVHPTARVTIGGHPLFSSIDNTATRTNAAPTPLNGLFTSGTNFPATTPAVMNSTHVVPRLTVLPGA